MLDENTQAKVNQTYQTTLMIWVGMLVTVAMYFALAFVMTSQKTVTPHAAPSLNTMRAILLTAAFSSVAVAHFIKQAMLGKFSPSNAASPEIIAGAFQSASIVTFGFSESAALYGLVLFFMSGVIKEMFPFAGISLAGFMIYFPRKNELESLVTEYRSIQRKK